MALALLTRPTACREVEEGPCPHKPGVIQSAVRESFDPARAVGPWINTYDEKELTNQYLCMGVNFKELKDGTTEAPQLMFEQANAIYEETRAALRE